MARPLWKRHEADMATAKPVPPPGASASGAPDIHAALTGNHLRLITRGMALRDALIALIDGARSSLKLYYYIFAADESGTLVRDALIAARARGVAVTLMVDAFGSSQAPDSFFAPLVEAGAHFGRFGARRSTRYLIRNHQKMAIADDARLLIGGFNVEDGYFGIPQEDCWRDLGLSIEGPQVEAMTIWYGQLWRWVSTRKQRFRTLRAMVRQWHPALHHDMASPFRWLIGGPTRRLSPWAQVVKHDLERARRVDMIAAYFSPGRGMLKRIARAAKVCGAAEGQSSFTTNRPVQQQVVRRARAPLRQHCQAITAIINAASCSNTCSTAAAGAAICLARGQDGGGKSRGDSERDKKAARRRRQGV